jgi:hypothetical protein
MALTTCSFCRCRKKNKAKKNVTFMCLGHVLTLQSFKCPEGCVYIARCDSFCIGSLSQHSLQVRPYQASAGLEISAFTLAFTAVTALAGDIVKYNKSWKGAKLGSNVPHLRCPLESA